MHQVHSGQSAARVATYALYGEKAQALMPDYLHFETIRERSSKHNWEIIRHRHENLVQLFLFNTANVCIRFNEGEVTTTRPTLLFLPPMVTHGFHFQSDVEGSVITLTTGRMNEAARFLNLDVSLLENTLLMSAIEDGFDEVVGQFGAIDAEYQDLGAYRYQALNAAFLKLLVSLMRAASGQLSPRLGQPSSADERLVQAFCHLIERKFHSDWRISQFAAALGTSEVSLTRACRRVMKLSPRKLILNRLLLEAKRKLAYTPHGISEIAFMLGFKDVGYFSRFFTRMTGTTPSAFRQETRKG